MLHQARITSILVWTCLLALSASVEAAPFKFAGERSRVAFKSTHLGITTATGRFAKFEGLAWFNPAEIEKTRVSLRIRTASVVSANPKIPPLMRSEKFFWSAQYPEIVFRSREVIPISEERFNIHGDLTIRGITRPAVFETELLPETTEEGHLRFQSHTFINRRDYEIGTHEFLGSLAAVMAESLRISLEVEGIPFADTDSAAAA